MKVGILTFQFAHNYGALLQAYALRSAVKKCGHDVTVLNFYPEKVRNEYSLNPLKAGKGLRGVLGSTKRSVKRINQYKKFRSFQKNMLGCINPIYSFGELEAVCKNMDCVVVGSDQVWNTDLTGDIKSYFLDFPLGGVKKVSYAASFGTTEINKSQQKYVKEYLPKFDVISVREQTAAELVKKYAGCAAAVVADPVFQLTKIDWEKFANTVNRLEKKENYILYYSLKSYNTLKKAAESLSQKMGLTIKAVHPTTAIAEINGEKLRDVGPVDFVWLIEHAAYVVTDSFHATAFSVIFGKKLLYIADSGLQTRVQSLFESLGIEYHEKEIIDLSLTDRDRLDKFRTDALVFLKDKILGE